MPFTAGDLFLMAVNEWMAHAERCGADECAECDVVLNRLRLARKVWLNSRHQLIAGLKFHSRAFQMIWDGPRQARSGWVDAHLGAVES